MVAVLLQIGRRLMGKEGAKPEFSNFSWFPMMFGAGLGVRLMVFATAEPLGLWGSNPEIISGGVNQTQKLPRYQNIDIHSCIMASMLRLSMWLPGFRWLITLIHGVCRLPFVLH